LQSALLVAGNDVSFAALGKTELIVETRSQHNVSAKVKQWNQSVQRFTRKSISCTLGPVNYKDLRVKWATKKARIRESTRKCKKL